MNLTTGSIHHRDKDPPVVFTTRIHIRIHYIQLTGYLITRLYILVSNTKKRKLKTYENGAMLCQTSNDKIVKRATLLATGSYFKYFWWRELKIESRFLCSANFLIGLLFSWSHMLSFFLTIFVYLSINFICICHSKTWSPRKQNQKTWHLTNSILK